MTMAGFLTKSTKGTSFRLLRKFSGDFFPFVFFVYGLRGLILSHSTREQLSSSNTSFNTQLIAFLKKHTAFGLMEYYSHHRPTALQHKRTFVHR